MVKLANSVSRFRAHKVLLLGDLMLDSYTIGEVRRVSPEAPVCILKVSSEEDRPGGAGNVALGLKELGADPCLLGRVGKDHEGIRLKRALLDGGVSTEYLLSDSSSRTIVKNRMVGSGQQMLRVDFEEIKPLRPREKNKILKSLDDLLDQVEVLALSDYNKGFFSRDFLQVCIAKARAKNVPVLVDPKGTDFSKYKGATLIKPNLQEAMQASGLEEGTPLEEVAEKLLQETEAQALLITRSQKGMSLFHADGRRQDVLAKAREVMDVTGAGDTVLSTLAVSMANGLSLEEAVYLANKAASLAVQRFGCATISLPELTESLLQENPVSKIFQEQDIFPLKLILRNKPFHLLAVRSKQLLTREWFQALLKLQQEDFGLVVYIRDKAPSKEVMQAVASQGEVDFIILKNASLSHLCKAIQPKVSYLLEEGLSKTCHKHLIKEVTLSSS